MIEHSVSRRGYYDDYSNLQKTKHLLIRNYLNGWLPKVGFTHDHIIYIDTHAGKGIYATGEEGSPLIALKTLLNHAALQKIISHCRIDFLFIEKEQSYVEALEKEVHSFPFISQNINVNIVQEDCFKTLESVFDTLTTKNETIPSFIFLDPFGFKLPGYLLCKIAALPSVELFITVMWREISMAMVQACKKPGLMNVIDDFFNTNSWRDTITATSFDGKIEQTVQFMRERMSMKWATYIRMRGPNNAVRYFLLHLTNNNQGRDLMKECMWKVCPNGEFEARRNDDYRQYYLINPVPDLTILREWVIEKLLLKPLRWETLSELLREEIWLDKHLNRVLKEMKRDKLIITESQLRFCRKNNPLLAYVGLK